MKAIGTALVIVVLLGLSFFIGRSTAPLPATEVRVDTLRDTIHPPVPKPEVRYIARTDTVFLRIAGDTVRVEVEVPIERKVFKTEDYKATVEGFRPELVDMEIYRQTRYITRTETIRIPDRRRWGIGLQAGYGATVSQGVVIARPYVGIGVSYNIVSW